MYNQPTQLAGLLSVSYRRKSHKSDRRQKLSLDSQSDICSELTSLHKLNPVFDFGERGSAKDSDQRPEFDKMISLILAGKAEVIVCWKIHRLARNMKEGGWLIDLLQKGVIKAIVTCDKIHFPNDHAIMQMIPLAEATQYSINLSNDVKVGLAKKARKGVPFGKAPIGYLNNKHKDKGERDWRDDPDRLEIWARVLKRILSYRYTPHQVWMWARNDLKLTTAPSRTRGGALICKNSFYKTLRRPEYAGFFFYDGVKRQITCKMTSIITEDEYWEIQNIVGERGRTRPKGDPKAYSGFIKSPEGDTCGPESKFHLVCDCKWKYSNKTRDHCPKCGKAEKDMEHPIYRSYVLYSNIKRRKSRQGYKTINEKKVDAFLMGYAKENFLLSASLARWSRKYIHELEGDKIKLHEQRLKARKTFLDEQAKKEKRAERALLNGVFSEEKYKEVVRELQRDTVVNTPSEEVVDLAEALDKIIDLNDCFVHSIEKGTIEEKRELMSRLGSTLIWNEENLSICNAKWLNTLIEGLKGVRGKNDGLEPVKYVVPQGENAKWEHLRPLLCRIWDDVGTCLVQDMSRIEDQE